MPMKGVLEARPGTLVVYRLNVLTKAEGQVDLDQWGLCEYNDHYWIGEQAMVEGREDIRVLKVSMLEILEKRTEQYDEWGDEEVYLLASRHKDSKEFQWCLLNQEEFDRERAWLQERMTTRH